MLYQSELPLLVWRLYHEAWYCSGGQLVRRHVPGMCGALHRVARTQARVEYPGLWKRRRSMAFWVATRAVETAPRGAPLQHTHCNTGKSLRKVLLRFVDPPKARRQHTARAPRALFLRMRFYRRHTVGSKEEYAGSVPVLVFQNITQATSHVCASRVGENGEHDGSSTT